MDTGNYKIFTDFFRTKNNSKIYFQDTTKDEEEKRQAAEEEKRQAAEEEKRQAKAAALATRR